MFGLYQFLNHRLFTLFSLLIVGGMLLASLPGRPALAAQGDDEIRAAIVAADRGKHAHPNLSSNLHALVDATDAEQVATAAAQDPEIELRGQHVKVMLVMQDVAAAKAASKTLARLEGIVTARYKTWIDAWVPVAQLDRVSRLRGVSIVRTPLYTRPVETPAGDQFADANAQPSRGRTPGHTLPVETPEATTDDLPAPLADESQQPMASATPEVTPSADIGILTGAAATIGVERSNADVWHRANRLGRDIRIAVVENSNGGFMNYQRSQASGELPAQIELYTGPEGMNVPVSLADTHGTEAAEIVHDMAPSAQLIFASPETGTELAQFIVDLARNRNVDIFSASLSLSGFSPGDGTGPVADAIAVAYHTYDALYVQSAGNQAEGHWDGAFKDTNNDGFHEFASGDTTNTICTSGSVYLRWNDWPDSSNDFDLYVWKEIDGRYRIVALSNTAQTGTQPPMESVTIPTGGCYDIMIGARNNIDRSRTHILNLWTFDKELEHQVRARSLLETATSAETIAVGAVVGDSHAITNYSSVGPTHGPGGSLSGGKAQPRIVGYADGSTSFGVMAGTSAAAPHVAGATALLMDLFGKDAALVKQQLEKRAVDTGAVGYDYEYGAGALQLRSPCQMIDLDEPNDDPGFVSGQPVKEVTPLSVNDFSTTAWMCGVNDIDWYWFNGTPSTPHIIEVVNRDGNTQARLRVKLYGKSANGSIELLATDEAGYNETASIEYTPLHAAVYRLEVTEVNGRQLSKSYLIRVRTRAIPAALDFFHGFDGMDYLIPAFTSRTSGSGRVQVTGDNGPYEGTRHLVLDSSAVGSKRSAAEVTLHLNTTGYQQLYLYLRHREYGDEANALTSQYTIPNPDGPDQPMVNGDGIAVSFDRGHTWYRILDLSGSLSSNTWQARMLDVGKVAQDNGAAIGTELRIRFHHYETGTAHPAPQDGFAFDNISVFGFK